jgi:hypothetical protein
MKSFFTIKCSCGRDQTLETIGVDSFADTKCDKCGRALIVVDDGFASWRIYNKARQFLQSGDYTLSTLLAAVSVECEVGRLYVKWRSIEAGLPCEVTDADREKFEDELRRCFKIVDTFDMVSQYLTTLKFDEFVRSDTSLNAFVVTAHPEATTEGSLRKFFEGQLFWKRNAIAHAGKIDSTRPEAEQGFNIANTLFKILAAMDATKQRLSCSPEIAP